MPPLYLAFIAACVLLMLFPGPNVTLIVANSMNYGVRFGLLTVAGTATAMALQLAFTALGMTALLGAAGGWFGLLRWAGAAYLIYLGIAQWRAPETSLGAARPDPNRRKIFLRAFLVSLTNPKTLFFYGAFFPQFISPGHGVGSQVAVLCVTFLAIELVIDCGWAALAHQARQFIGRNAKWRNRITGGALIGAGVALAGLRTK
jgi:threonine/homoserine/homoserine lactone efflux protein